VGVHGICGALGTILTGLFAVEDGLFYGGGAAFLLVQLLGVIVVIAWVAVAMTVVFLIIKHTIGLRVSEVEEIAGLDIHEHGLVSAYADFMPSDIYLSSGMNEVTEEVAATKKSAAETVPVTRVTVAKDGMPAPKMTKVEIITKQSKFETLKAAMNAIGVTGMTVTNVLGCGIQKGSTEYYRGVPMEMNLLPKVQIEVVVSKVPVDLVIEEARKALYTGNIGDGKIFVYDVENVVKVRTGEMGYDALQGEE
jgi:Amt family ammonium transporter